jgi:hypothetical protein
LPKYFYNYKAKNPDMVFGYIYAQKIKKWAIFYYLRLIIITCAKLKKKL